jgi:hypothetical protein
VAVSFIVWLGPSGQAKGNRHANLARCAGLEAPLAKRSDTSVVEKLMSCALLNGNGCHFPGLFVDVQNETAATGLVLSSRLKGIFGRDLLKYFARKQAVSYVRGLRGHSRRAHDARDGQQD